MKIVSNTSPICYLVLIDQIDLLPTFFGNVIVPEAVRIELENRAAPEVVRTWIQHPPSWLTVQSVTSSFDPILDLLHAGEQEAIRLASDLSADLIILDEKAARQVALKRGLKVVGLLGILQEAATCGLITLPAVIDRLSKTNFRASPRLLKSLLDANS
jgi:predicted nucleic acid-binding protein